MIKATRPKQTNTFQRKGANAIHGGVCAFVLKGFCFPCTLAPFALKGGRLARQYLPPSRSDDLSHDTPSMDYQMRRSYRNGLQPFHTLRPLRLCDLCVKGFYLGFT